MKEKFINAIGAGEFVKDIFVLTEKSLAQKRDGKNFLNVILSDKTGDLKGVVWDNVDDIVEHITSGDFVYVEGSVNEYKGALQIVVKKMEVRSADSVDPGDYLPETGRDIEKMFERLLSIAATLKSIHLKALFEDFWKDEEFVRKFKAAPAAKKMHHAYLGGLLEHTLSMVSLADKIAGHYTGINKELLIAGTILHDIGKIREFDYTYKIDYSDEGRLLNHIVIGIQMIDEKIKKIEDFPEEQALLLKHLVVSHHGFREFGSPEPPKTIEAVLLNYIDEIDSKVNGIRDFISREDPGEAWTAYHKVFERHFYKGKQ